MSDEVKTCISCAHCKGSGDENQVYNPHVAQPFRRPDPECAHPKAKTRDPIYGRTLCHNERNETNKKGCGPKGKLWEPKIKES